MSRNLLIGDLAPSFALQAHTGEAYSLASALRSGPVVLVFYPYDQSPTCTKRLCAINRNMDEYAAVGAQIFGINNADEESHAGFADQAALIMPLLSDRNFEVARAYDALFELGPIRVIRSTVVVIDRHGVVVFSKHGSLPTNRQIIGMIRGLG